MSGDALYDLRGLLRAVGHHPTLVGLGDLEDRPDPEIPAQLLDAHGKKVTAQPLDVAGFVDGIQAGLVLTYRAARPVYLCYVAAGALGAGGVVRGLKESLWVSVSTLDEEWARSLPGGIPVEILDSESPFELGRRGTELLRQRRENFERSIVEDLEGNLGDTYLVVDGSVTSRSTSDHVVGVVKTTATRYLADESVLFTLPAGWRSARFVLPRGMGGATRDRVSCYFRLRTSRGPWDYGLVRLESYDAEVLDALCARCWLERQSRDTADVRGDRHLATIRAVETYLRGRRPFVFDAA